ncbi:Cobalamin biosynthesis protein CobD [subsurface metagenome]|nr:cobalamin biosynthesis protein CobD [Methanosarcinales archaeon]
MNLLQEHVIIFLIAILIDVTVGDPPEKREKYYPIVWISRLMYFFDRRTKRGNERKEKLLGVIYPIVILAIFALPCLMLLRIHSELLYIVLGSLIFKMTFTVKGLEGYGRDAMEAKNLEEKREAVGKIVSRDVAGLDTSQLDSATIESVAENTTDSVIAPFFYFALFGVFGAMCYRVVNTLDAVVGYKNRRYIHFGWFSAKADDVMNYIPERVAAWLILLLSGSKLGDLRNRSYENENAPLTIAAMSRALKVKLEKVGHYVVGESFEDARSEHIAGAIRIAKRSTILFAFVCVVVMAVIYLSDGIG